MILGLRDINATLKTMVTPLARLPAPTMILQGYHIIILDFFLIPLHPDVETWDSLSGQDP